MPSSPISPCPSCPPHAAGGHGCAVYSSSVTDAEWAILEPLLACAGQHGRPRRTTREALLPCDSGRHPVYRARWYRVAATAGAVPASPRWCTRCSPAGPAAGRGRSSPTRCATDCGSRAGRDRSPERGDHRLADGTRRRHRARPAAAGRAPRNERRQAAHRRGGERPAVGVDVTAASIQDDAAHHSWPLCAAASPPSGWSGPTPVTPDGRSSGRKTFSPILCRSSNASPAPLVSTSGPAFGWSRGVSRASTSTAAAARLRNQTRPPRSHGPPRDDHDHDQATRRT